jgi:hypothetical protein
MAPKSFVPSNPNPHPNNYNGFRPPLPHHGIDGEITNGTSYKFNNTTL